MVKAFDIGRRRRGTARGRGDQLLLCVPLRSAFAGASKRIYNEDLAYDAVYVACVASALKHLGGQDLTDLSDAACWLIQAVLLQVKMLMERRGVMRP